MPNFSKRQVGILRNWLQGNLESPYLSMRDYDKLSRQSGLSAKQIQIWFTNARKVRTSFFANTSSTAHMVATDEEKAELAALAKRSNLKRNHLK